MHQFHDKMVQHYQSQNSVNCVKDQTENTAEHPAAISVKTLGGNRNSWMPSVGPTHTLTHSLGNWDCQISAIKSSISDGIRISIKNISAM